MLPAAARRLSIMTTNTSSPQVAAALFLAGVGACRYFNSSSALLSADTPAESSTVKTYKKSPVYTRTGDAGTSSLYNGERRAKVDDIFHALGHQDELNAVLGIAIEYCVASKNGLEDRLIDIQSRLFDLGAAVATPQQTSPEQKVRYTKFPADHTRQLERWIDELDSQLPKITNFVLPSGGLSATHINLARAICRRAERSVVALVADGAVDAEVGKYLNRLSDFLFVASRYATMKEGREETIWRLATPSKLA